MNIAELHSAGIPRQNSPIVAAGTPQTFSVHTADSQRNAPYSGATTTTSRDSVVHTMDAVSLIAHFKQPFYFRL